MKTMERIRLLLMATVLLVCGLLFYRGQSATQLATEQAEGAMEVLELDNLRQQLILDRALDSTQGGSVAVNSLELGRNDAAIAEISSVTLFLLRKQIFWERMIMGGSLIGGLLTLLVYSQRLRQAHNRDE